LWLVPQVEGISDALQNGNNMWRKHSFSRATCKHLNRQMDWLNSKLLSGSGPATINH
jgi:hypothetical protein